MFSIYEKGGRLFMKIERTMNFNVLKIFILLLAFFALFNLETSKSKANAQAHTTLIMDEDIRMRIHNVKTIETTGELKTKRLKFVDIHNRDNFFIKESNNESVRLPNGTYNIFDITAQGNNTNHDNLTPGSWVIVDNETVTPANIILNYYNVTFYQDMSKSVILSQSNVLAGNNISEPTSPSKDMYTFAGWVDKNGVPFNFNNRIYASTEVYATWNEAGEALISDLNRVKSNIYSKEVSSTFLFTGGNMTISPEGSNGYRNYIQHFEERIRWEISSSLAQRQNFVFNTQKKGMTASQLLTEFNERVIQYQPKTVFVNLGYDDALQNTEISSFKTNLTAIINRIREADAVPVLESPIYPTDQSIAEKIKIYVDAMKEVALEDGVLFMNHFRWTIYNDRVSITAADGVTPNELGHLRLSKELMNFFGIGGSGSTWGINGFKDRQGTYNFTAKLGNNSSVTTSDDALTKLIQGDKPLTWLFTGDSITHGALHTKGYQSFVELFGERVKIGLSEIYPTRENDIVLNIGISSMTTRDLLENFERWITLNNPDVVFINFGVTDCTNRLVPLNEYTTNLRTVVDKVREIGAIPVLQTPNTIKQADTGRILNIPYYINSIREVAKETNTILIDHYRYWTDAEKMDSNLREKWLADTAHPNHIGTAKMADTIFQTLGLN